MFNGYEMRETEMEVLLCKTLKIQTQTVMREIEARDHLGRQHYYNSLIL